MQPLPRPGRRILTDTVYEAIKGLIVDQHIAPEARVNIDLLARQLSVSPTPVREALARLESDGLVTKEPLRGYSTTPLLDASSFADLYDMRLLLEPYAARLTAVRANAEHLQALEKAVSAMRTAATGPTYRE